MESDSPQPRPGGHIVGVVCLHASSSSSRQWRALAEYLAGRFTVRAPDLYGSGESPLWTENRPLTFADELAKLEPAFDSAGNRFHLIGHSYGGAVALHATLAEPSRVRSLVLIEPVLFGLLMDDDGLQPTAREIMAVRDDTVAATATGDLDGAARRFIDYWMGTGTWADTPERRRALTRPTMVGVSSQWQAIFADPTPLSGYASLQVPTLLLTGARSPAPSRAVAALLTRTLPNLNTIELADTGHMAPVSHPDQVNALIEAHVARHA
jgi:pimeloyl-ACP methyl ester carboxylesterase